MSPSLDLQFQRHNGLVGVLERYIPATSGPYLTDSSVYRDFTAAFPLVTLEKAVDGQIHRYHLMSRTSFEIFTGSDKATLLKVWIIRLLLVSKVRRVDIYSTSNRQLPFVQKFAEANSSGIECQGFRSKNFGQVTVGDESSSQGLQNTADRFFEGLRFLEHTIHLCRSSLARLAYGRKPFLFL